MKILPFARSGSSINDLSSTNFAICSGAVHCCECHQSSYILCVVKIGFEDNALTGGENDRIAKNNEKKPATADQ